MMASWDRMMPRQKRDGGWSHRPARSGRVDRRDYSWLLLLRSNERLFLIAFSFFYTRIQDTFYFLGIAARVFLVQQTPASSRLRFTPLQNKYVGDDYVPDAECQHKTEGQQAAAGMKISLRPFLAICLEVWKILAQK